MISSQHVIYHVTSGLESVRIMKRNFLLRSVESHGFYFTSTNSKISNSTSEAWVYTMNKCQNKYDLPIQANREKLRVKCIQCGLKYKYAQQIRN